MIDSAHGGCELRARACPGTVWLAGEVDVSNHHQLALVLDSATPGHGGVVIDLSAVSFIDVHGTGQIVHFARRLAPQRTAVKSAPPFFRTMLEVQGSLDEIDLLDFCPVCSGPMSRFEWVQNGRHPPG
jgi:anti-anti-sigma regulatory factor